MPVRVLPVCVLLLLFLASAILAETPELSGVVLDPEGAPVEDAAVFILRSDRSVVASTRTDKKGEFRFAEFRGGYDSLLVQAKGFEDYWTSATAGHREIRLGLEPVSEQVTVTASRDRVDEIDRVPQQVNIITAEELQQRARTVLAEAVSEEPGLAMQRTASTMGGVFVRGLTGNKVNVFVDGIRYSNSAARGGVNTFFNLVDPNFLDRVEVLRGPSSAQYGSDALGGSIQLLSRLPSFSTGAPVVRSSASLYGNSSDEGFGAFGQVSYATTNIALLVDLNARRTNELRPGGGLDSRNAVTRFFDISSDIILDGRLPGTDFTQYGGNVKLGWALSDDSQITASYIRGQQDGGKRYDQLIGGDGNLIADLRNLMLDLAYVRYDKTSLGWFDHFTASYSFNTQREERVNQGGNGNPRASINHEYERTSVNGLQAQFSKIFGTSQTLALGGDFYSEGVDAPSYKEDPVTGATAVRRGRIPDGATYRHGGVFAEYVIDAVADRLQMFANLRFGAASYNASASDSPLVNGEPLWPDDSLSVNSLTYRIGAVYRVAQGMEVAGNINRGFRAPHTTDLGTLGLTGAGFEVAYPDVAGLNATIGSSASSSAISTGIPVAQLKPETSQTYELAFRYHRDRIESDFTFFVNNVSDNITKQALILPQGAVGTVLGDQTIIAQTPDGAVFVPASSSPVLVRANYDDARLYGFEYSGNVRINSSWSAGGIFTYIRAEDLRTGLPPNIEGGTPAPDGYVKARYSTGRKGFWVEPYVHFALKQDRLSSLDLEDRRTGAGRSRSNITNFFYNGATVRGLVGAGADGAFGTADDVLQATGETLSQILLRVLGPDYASSSLFTELPAYATLNVRVGFTFAEQHRFLLELLNLTDENYRGISWGMDGPGRGVYLRYNIEF